MNDLNFKELTTETDKSVLKLREKLDIFYSSCQEYTAFREPNHNPGFWQFIKNKIVKCLEIKGNCKVLEMGAGCTGFAAYLEDIREQVIFDVQDVTDTNKKYLLGQADRVYIADVTEIEDSYDIIFSTFVWEHITTPQAVLEHLVKILNPHGSIFIISPCYDFPFYLSPSAKHLSKFKRFLLSIWLIFNRLKVIIINKPNFLIHLDPAVFKSSWFRDSDAIHWVSFWDLKAYINNKYSQQLKLHKLNINMSNDSFKNWLWHSFLLLFVEIEKK